MASAVLIVSYRTKEWLRAAELVRSKLQAQGYDVSILDISEEVWPSHVLTPRLAEADYSSPTLNKDLAASLLSEEEISAFLHSLIKSYKRNSNATPSKFERMRLSRSLNKCASRLTHNNMIYQADVVCIPNGRFAHEVLAARLAAPKAEILWYELPLWGKDCYLSTASPQDAVALNEKLRELTSCLDSKQIRELSEASLGIRRDPSLGINKYLTEDIDDTKLEARRNRDESPAVAVLFTSSQDEFPQYGRNASLASEWDHVRAFRAAVEELLRKGYQRIVIRVHPNIANKSRAEYKREMRAWTGLAKLDSRVELIPPTFKISSYQLVEKAKVVVSWWSSIALEAAAVGVASIALSKGRYTLNDGVILATDEPLLRSAIQNAEAASLKCGKARIASAQRTVAGLSLIETFAPDSKSALRFHQLHAREIKRLLKLSPGILRKFARLVTLDFRRRRESLLFG